MARRRPGRASRRAERGEARRGLRALRDRVPRSFADERRRTDPAPPDRENVCRAPDTPVPIRRRSRPSGGSAWSARWPPEPREPGTPPAPSAWKNFTSPNPASVTRISSVAVATPGTNGMGRSAVRSAALDPGLTANAAPAATTCSNWAIDTTVPAPTTTPVDRRTHGRDRGHRAGRSERDLHHRHPVSHEDASQLDRVPRVVDLDQRKHPLRPQQLGQRHRCPARHVR